VLEKTSFPLTEPHAAPIFDTGPHPEPLQTWAGVEDFDTDALMRPLSGSYHAEPFVVPPQRELSGAHLKRWQFAAIVAGTWVAAAAAGVGFYNWWYTSMDKTAAVFGVFVYLTLCMVGSVLTSLVPEKPRMAGLAIAVMSAPLASTAAAAALHGAYYFEWIARPAIG
jgi:hypothetical protein